MNKRYKILRYAMLKADVFVIAIYDVSSVRDWDNTSIIDFFRGIKKYKEIEKFLGYYKIGSRFYEYLNDATRFNSIDEAEDYLKRKANDFKIERELKL